jgi:hypothetical protein
MPSFRITAPRLKASDHCSLHHCCGTPPRKGSHAPSRWQPQFHDLYRTPGPSLVRHSVRTDAPFRLPIEYSENKDLEEALYAFAFLGTTNVNPVTGKVSPNPAATCKKYAFVSTASLHLCRTPMENTTGAVGGTLMSSSCPGGGSTSRELSCMSAASLKYPSRI